MSLNISAASSSCQVHPRQNQLQHSTSSPSLVGLLQEYQSRREAAFPEEAFRNRQVRLLGSENRPLTPRNILARSNHNGRTCLSPSLENRGRQLHSPIPRSMTPASDHYSKSRAVVNGQVVPPPGFGAKAQIPSHRQVSIQVPASSSVASPPAESPSIIRSVWDSNSVPQNSPAVLPSPPVDFTQNYPVQETCSSGLSYVGARQRSFSQQDGSHRFSSNSSFPSPRGQNPYHSVSGHFFIYPVFPGQQVQLVQPQYVVNSRAPRALQSPSPSDSLSQLQPRYSSPNMGWSRSSSSGAVSTSLSGRESVEGLVRTGTPDWDQTVVGVVNSLQLDDN